MKILLKVAFFSQASAFEIMINANFLVKIPSRLDWAYTDKSCQAGRQEGRQAGSPHFLVNTLET